MGQVEMPLCILPGSGHHFRWWPAEEHHRGHGACIGELVGLQVGASNMQICTGIDSHAICVKSIKHLSIYPSIRPSIHPSIYPCIHLSIHPSIHPSMYKEEFLKTLEYEDLYGSTPGAPCDPHLWIKPASSDPNPL